MMVNENFSKFNRICRNRSEVSLHKRNGGLTMPKTQLFSAFRDAYKKHTGKDLTLAEAIQLIDTLIEKVKAAYSLSNALIDVLRDMKKGFYGIDFNVSSEKLKAAIKIIQDIVTLSTLEDEDKDLLRNIASFLTEWINKRATASRGKR